VTNTASLVLETVEGRGLRFRARVGGGQEMVLDSGPGRSALNPVEALLASLGGCEGMDVIEILRKKRQQVTGYEVALIGERRAEHPRSYTRIELVHRLRGRDLSPAAVEEAIRLSQTKYCSVHASLGKEIEIVSRYEIVPDR
jgi:putative redox protein